MCMNRPGDSMLETRSPASPQLRTRRERPGGSRAAERDQQFSPSDGDCHTPLPCEVRKRKDITPLACCLNRAAPKAGGAHAR